MEGGSSAKTASHIERHIVAHNQLIGGYILGGLSYTSNLLGQSSESCLIGLTHRPLNGDGVNHTALRDEPHAVSLLHERAD